MDECQQSIRLCRLIPFFDIERARTHPFACQRRPKVLGLDFAVPCGRGLCNAHGLALRRNQARLRITLAQAPVIAQRLFAAIRSPTGQPLTHADYLARCLAFRAPDGVALIRQRPTVKHFGPGGRNDSTVCRSGVAVENVVTLVHHPFLEIMSYCFWVARRHPVEKAWARNAIARTPGRTWRFDCSRQYHLA